MAQQNVEVRIVGKDQASREILGVGTALDRMKISVENNKAGLGKLDGALKDSATNMLGLSGTAGQLTKALIEFAPGGLIGGAVVAGVAFLANNFIKTAEAQEEARQSLMDYLEGANQLRFAQDQLNLPEVEAAYRNIARQLTLLSVELFEAETKSKQLAETLKGVLEFEAERPQGLLERLFIGADPTSVVYSANEIAKITKDATEAFAESNRLLAEQANLMLQMQNIGMIQLDNDIKRYQSLRSLQQLNRLSVDEQNELVFLTNKLVNFSNDLNVSAEVRLKSLNATADITKRAADEQKRLNDFTEQTNRLYREAEERAVSGFLQRMAAEKQRQQEVQGMIEADIQKFAENLAATMDTSIAKLPSLDFSKQLASLTQIAFGIADGFDVMTNAIMNGENAFKALEMGARAAVRNILRVFAQEQIAKGIGAIGSALSATALGNVASAGLFYKSAAKHFAAAAAAGVASGVVGGGGSNRGGGGGGFSNSGLGSTPSQSGPIIITIAGGGILDMNNPETARSFVNALNTVTNRRAIITTRP